MNAAIRNLSARYTELSARIEAEPKETTTGGGARLTLRAAGLVEERGRVAHMLAREVRDAIAAEKPAPESAQPICGSCGGVRAVDGCPICDAGRLAK